MVWNAARFRRILIDEYDSICFYCGAICDEQDIQIDHVDPSLWPGRNKMDNLRLACPSCNSSKSDRTLEDWFRHISKRHSRAKHEIEYCENILDAISMMIREGGSDA